MESTVTTEAEIGSVDYFAAKLRKHTNGCVGVDRIALALIGAVVDDQYSDGDEKVARIGNALDATAVVRAEIEAAGR